MAKQAKVKLTPVQIWDREVKKWTARRDSAIAALTKADTRLQAAERRLERAKKREARQGEFPSTNSANSPPRIPTIPVANSPEVLQGSSGGPLETPELGWRGKVTVPVAGTGLAPGAAPGTTVDLDIPTFLQRAPDKTQAELRAAQEEVKEAKRKAQAARRKAIRAETQAHDKIPTSKRRWDAGKAMWISD